jgi:cytoplasmic iron level regulating protein YaaA (DUF328/UPF0246 family)
VRDAAALVLLPPSEGKAPGGVGRWKPESGAFASLARARRDVIRAYADADIERVVGTSGAIAERARANARQLRLGRAPALPAIERFTGVVWEHLGSVGDPGRIAVISALCGVVAGDDPVPDHRLKLSVSLGDLGRLDRWWRPRVTTALVRWADGRPVWNLLPNEHVAAVDLTQLDVVQVRFVSADGARAVGHFAKAAKGALAGLLLRGAPIATFDFQGWRTSRDGDEVLVIAPAP